MTISIPIEQPPKTGDRALDEWLTRMMIKINSSFAQVPDFEPTGQLPQKVRNGTCFYASVAILPHIPAPGPYMYVEGVWQSMV